jgi:uncharacterized protein (TIGR03437 family)
MLKGGPRLAAGLAIVLLAPFGRASEANALAISASIQALHVPYGSILDPIFAAPGSTQIVDYTRCGDSAIWTGHYLAAEAFRYKVTGSAEALNNVQNAVSAINNLIQVTGTNLLARCALPLNSPYAASIQSQESANGIYTNASANEFWVGNTSRDQYIGVAFGLAVAYDMVDDADLQSTISNLAWLLIGFLTGHNWSVVMPDGSSSTTFLIRPDEILTLLQIGRHLNPGKFSTDYDTARILLSPSVALPITVDIASNSSYFKFNLDYISFYNLVRLESSSIASLYQAAYGELSGATLNQQNAIFDIVDRALNGPNAARDANTVAFLNEWLQRPSYDVTVNLQGVVPSCNGSACNPIPVAVRPPDEYLWQESPYQLSGGGSGIIQGSGVDYILPYWMARYYGVIQPVEVHSAAAPNGAVAPGSLASVFGSQSVGNLASASQTASTPVTALGGVTLTVTDSTGASAAAPLLYVSPSQINFVVPSGLASGMAQLTIQNGGSTPITTSAILQSVAPTLFSMSGDGRGVAAAQAVETTNSNNPVQTMVPVFQCSAASGCTAVPIVLSPNYTTTLVLYGTGIRSVGSLANVTANINGTNVPVEYAGPQATSEGLDQVNLTLPPSLSGSASVNVILTVAGQTANPVSIDIQ